MGSAGVLALAMLVAGALPPGPGPFPEAGVMMQPVPGAARAIAADGWKVCASDCHDDIQKSLCITISCIQ